MNRSYLNFEDQDQGLFVGKEVENIKTRGRQTLFVSRILFTPEDIVREAIKHECSVIYFGANHVYHYFISEVALKAIATFINDYPEFEVVLEIQQTMLECVRKHLPTDKIHLIVSIPVPNLHNIDNLYIKLDDSGFNATNEGVWTISAHQIKQFPNSFTPWSAYAGDELV